MAFTKPQGVERRTFTAELRASDEFAIIGYASVFNSWSKDLGGFREMVRPGAFARSIREGADVFCLFNHAPDNVLGRTKSGTLTISEDAHGLRYRCQLDRNNSQHRDLYAAIKRGDVDSCSFAFSVPKGGCFWNSGPDGLEERTLTDVDLIDVSPVVYPAYSSTQVDARSGGKTGKPAPADIKEIVKQYRRAARAMAGLLIGTAKRESPYPSPYDYKSLAARMDLCCQFAEAARALSEDIDDTLCQWDDAEENGRARRESPYPQPYDYREAHRYSHASLGVSCEACATTRAHLGKLFGGKK